MYPCVPHVCLVTSDIEHGMRSPRARATDGYELLCVCWESKSMSMSSALTKSTLNY